MLILPISSVNAQYQKCYDDQFNFILRTSAEKSIPINVNDPEITDFIASLCYYLHGKTGQWNTYETDQDTMVKYTGEFFQKYDVPEIIYELINE